MPSSFEQRLFRFFSYCLTDDSGNFLIRSRHGIIIVLMLNKRKSPRRKMVLPVKVSIDMASGLAHTLDITPSGARLGALRHELQPGTIITLQRGAKKAEFRIAWVKQLATNELQAGIEALQPQNNFWGINLSDDADVKRDAESLMSLLARPSKSMM